jgi:hypothetical protein
MHSRIHNTALLYSTNQHRCSNVARGAAARLSCFPCVHLRRRRTLLLPRQALRPRRYADLATRVLCQYVLRIMSVAGQMAGERCNCSG